MKELQSIADLQEAMRLLDDTINKEELIDTELDELMKGNATMEERIREFNKKLPGKLHPVQKESKGLAHTINETCTLAENISRKVRDLDTTRARLKETTKKVDDIIDIKNCIDIVKKAMEAEDYETAASHIQRYLGLNIDESVLEGTSYEHLRSAEQQLKALVRNKLESLESALSNDLQSETIRFCKLYAPLGLKEEGLTRYCHYLRRMCSNEADMIYKDLLRSLGRNIGGHMPAEPLTCVTAITKVFECVAGIIEEQTDIVESQFGQGSGMTMIRNLVAQCDAHASKIIDLFLDNYGVLRKVQDLGQPRGLSEKERDPRELAHVLDEIVALCKAAEFYARFIKKKDSALATVANNSGGITSNSAGATHNNTSTTESKVTQPSSIVSRGLLISDVSRRMHEMINHYISLEQYFMVESVQKAIKMDEHTGDGLTSSMVDYVFFVLQKCTQRAVDTHNIHGLCAIINHLTTCLNKDYKEVLQKMFKDQLNKHVGRGSDLKPSLLVVLNNLEVSADYMLRLKKEIEAKCDKIFSQPEEREKLKLTIVDLQDTAKLFKALLEACMEQLCVSLQPKMRIMIDLFDAVSYEITEQDYASNEINDPFAQQFIAEAATFLKPFEEHLTPTNYDTFVHVVVGVTLKKFEKLLFQKRVSQLGALQFDKDFRAVSGYFSSRSQRTVRDKFARLTQMASLLNLEKVSEVGEIWVENSGSITWRLTPTEVRKVLMLRVDFPHDQIARLKL